MAKRVGDLHVEHGGQRFKFPLKLDVKRGTFESEHNGKTYTAGTKVELERKMAEVAKVLGGIEWRRYIVLEYEARDTQQEAWSYSSRTVGLGRRACDEVRGIDLHWKIREFSSPHIPVGEDDEVILERNPDSDEAPDVHRPRGRGRHRSLPEMPKWAIP